MCPMDLTGSSKDADKQKANAKASERFRNRKREEAQRELLIKEQRNEIKFLLKLSSFYKSKRDFYSI
ncbi:hypothetical protein N7471_010714 [Penicillium samsonianum]|uniref:uncharacterized protein n=1 Tax=Penicillium samsonianum TaxID=1882272 RepID=UPI002548CF66|nr:uncharacterized protein N7471_010714 [Penicillium samsonianum]KAJ6126221.1 hypothetical protein N7471_010714 [Penicillium samsonianum]